MEEVIELIKESAEDFLLSKNEKRDLKNLIRSKKFSKREFDYLRSNIFDIAASLKNKFTKEQLILWLENTNKLTLIGEVENSSANKSYFSPGTSCRSAIISQIQNAKSSIKICVFTISDNEISNAIAAAHKKGIGVKILTDNDKSFDMGSDIESMYKKGLNIKMDRTEYHMHHKFCIIDKETLLTGSYNWTRSAAERNQENILITTDNKTVSDFLREFERLWEKMADY